ncbi:MAG: carbon monoxide dehydrogenase subunit G [Natronomonas sp.]|jgi:carbon monoxide dehydrogenase subunit G|uniref:CoxG family protein n=1 Tax=Natronomonas sp. TaxID=2184060 RepID=UPI00398A4D45
MTVRVERSFELPASQAEVWEFIADPEKRARPISVVEDFETTGETTAIWHVKLPIPRINRTITVETQDIRREEPRYVKFTGRSKAMNVQGEHTLESTDTGTRVINVFVVDGRLPGVETYFKRKLDDELKNLENAIRDDLDV